jgi:hypothetical protein
MRLLGAKGRKIEVAQDLTRIRARMLQYDVCGRCDRHGYRSIQEQAPHGRRRRLSP